ncbi:MAG: hypothetical protein JWM68_2520 [Verrucomicrobiales bacterium]|nr:hypothetical protein [Verrucomicrobiales bacterium]
MNPHAVEFADVIEELTTDNGISFAFGDNNYTGLLSLAAASSMNMTESGYDPTGSRKLQVMAYQFGTDPVPDLHDFVVLPGDLSCEVMERTDVRNPLTNAVVFYVFKLSDQAQ